MITFQRKRRKKVQESQELCCKSGNPVAAHRLDCACVCPKKGEVETSHRYKALKPLCNCNIHQDKTSWERKREQHAQEWFSIVLRPRRPGPHPSLLQTHPATAPPSPTKRHTKVSVIGVGNVGMAIAQTILTQDLVDELALVDVNADKLRGEMLDLQHAAAFLPRTKIHASVDYAITAGSDLCIVTAGARQIAGESRLNLLQRNVSLFSRIVPPLAKYSPDSILLIVSNPVDILTYVAWKLSGFPSNRVLGRARILIHRGFGFSSPIISTSTLRMCRVGVGNLTGCSMINNGLTVLYAYIVGEHGDSSVALWSSISVGGVPVLSFLEKQQIAYEKETLENIHKAVIDSAYEVISLKGYTSWAIGYSAASLARSILRNQRRIHPVSVL
ncbi:L-lactate dehydrogenase B, partial [Vitis vinifera]